MDKFVICGEKVLSGRVAVSGAKNATLELLPAALLAPGVYNLSNTPDLRDVWTMSRLMASMGVHTELNDSTLFVDTRNITSQEAPYEHVKRMRASIHVLGPLLARYGYAKVSLPGGCAWGPRPVDFHLKGLERLGADITIENGYIIARAKKLKGAKISFDTPSVGATFNVMAAATLAVGRTVITNAAMEPEVTAAGRFLQKMGAQIDGLGTSTIIVEGVKDLKSCDEETIPDRIEAGTLLIAIAMTRGTATLTNTNPYHLAVLLEKLEQTGCEIDIRADEISITGPETLSPVDIFTAVYPGFPTDLQAQWIALMTCADGTSRVTDSIYKDRFTHVPELARLGCDIQVNENSATIRGGKRLTGATVLSTDLRASAAMVLAGLVAEGVTEVLRVYHLDRGYEALELKLQSLGADIRREKTESM